MACRNDNFRATGTYPEGSEETAQNGEEGIIVRESCGKGTERRITSNKQHVIISRLRPAMSNKKRVGRTKTKSVTIKLFVGCD